MYSTYLDVSRKQCSYRCHNNGVIFEEVLDIVMSLFWDAVC